MILCVKQKMKTAATCCAAISENGGILFYGIDSTAVVRRMEQLHKTSAVTTAALGRLLTGVAMMGQMLKSDSDSVTVQIKGGRPRRAVFWPFPTARAM